MDLADLKRRAEQAREYEQRVGGRWFRLRLPSRYETATAFLAAGREHGPALHAMLCRAIVAWEGVHVRDILPSAPEADEPLPCTPETIPLYLDEDIGTLAELAAEFRRRTNERAEALEASAKKSPSTSPGSSTGRKSAVSPSSASAH
jgi:hypothetical protein